MNTNRKEVLYLTAAILSTTFLVVAGTVLFYFYFTLPTRIAPSFGISNIVIFSLVGYAPYRFFKNIKHQKGQSIMQARAKSILYSTIFGIMGVLLEFLSIVLGKIIPYRSGDFVALLPAILPMVIGMTLFGFTVLFLMDRDKPYFYRTGIMGLFMGLVMIIFAFVTFYLNGAAYILTGFLVLGFLMLIFAVIRLIIQGGISISRK